MTLPTSEISEKRTLPSRLVDTRPSLKKAYVVSLVIAITVVAIFVLQSFYPDLIGPFTNFVIPMSASGAFVSSFFCMRKYGLRLRTRMLDRVWFALTLGMGLSAAGETAWSIYYFSGMPVPYPSIADVFYIGGYIPLALGLLFYFKPFSVALTRRRLGISIATILTCSILVFDFVLPVELASNPTFLTMISDLIYFILDLLLLSLTILNLSIFLGGTIGKWLIILAGGFALDVVGDEVFFSQVAQGTYYNGSASDLLYVLAYLLFALSFYVHRKEL